MVSSGKNHDADDTDMKLRTFCTNVRFCTTLAYLGIAIGPERLKALSGKHMLG